MFVWNAMPSMTPMTSQSGNRRYLMPSSIGKRLRFTCRTESALLTWRDRDADFAAGMPVARVHARLEPVVAVVAALSLKGQPAFTPT